MRPEDKGGFVTIGCDILKTPIQYIGCKLYNSGTTKLGSTVVILVYIMGDASMQNTCYHVQEVKSILLIT